MGHVLYVDERQLWDDGNTTQIGCLVKQLPRRQLNDVGPHVLPGRDPQMFG
jgi:hypothetical protein